MRWKKMLYAAFLSGILLMGYMYLETRWIKINCISYVSRDIPESFDSVKLVYISDIHHGPYFSRKRLSRLFEKINAIEPDIIALGGDYVQHHEKYIKPFFEEASVLKAPMGIYGIIGNHDHWEGTELARQSMLKNGICICDNQSYWIHHTKDSIKVGGVGDYWEDLQIIENTIFDLCESDFSILLCHNPDYFEEMNSDLIDLALSGHTHGGQVTVFGQWAPVLPVETGNKYRKGFVKHGSTNIYISTGVGTVTPPLRFFCRPEIVVFTLKSRQEESGIQK